MSGQLQSEIEFKTERQISDRVKLEGALQCELTGGQNCKVRVGVQITFGTSITGEKQEESTLTKKEEAAVLNEVIAKKIKDLRKYNKSDNKTKPEWMTRSFDEEKELLAHQMTRLKILEAGVLSK